MSKKSHTTASGPGQARAGRERAAWSPAGGSRRWQVTAEGDSIGSLPLPTACPINPLYHPKPPLAAPPAVSCLHLLPSTAPMLPPSAANRHRLLPPAATRRHLPPHDTTPASSCCPLPNRPMPCNAAPPARWRSNARPRRPRRSLPPRPGLAWPARCSVTFFFLFPPPHT